MMRPISIALLLVSIAFAPCLYAQSATTWRTTDGSAVMNGVGDLCWRDANGVNAKTDADCAKSVTAETLKTAASAEEIPVETVAPTKLMPQKPNLIFPSPISACPRYAADVFFDTNQTALKPEGKTKLMELKNKIDGINLEVIVAVGHTDATGNNARNQKLSVQRAETVKAYLITLGIEEKRIYTEGKGDKQPVADNKTAQGKAKNRRVELEVVGTRKPSTYSQ